MAPLWQGMTYIGVLNNGTNADIITTNLSQVFLPATPETFLHDPDGNLTNDGRFSYTWDAENRLTTATSQTNAPAGSKRKLTFEYDHQGRRVRLGVSVWTNNNWLVTTSNKFCYDGWNLVAELNATNNAVIRTYAWGLDLSGTMQGAGGVGGLLWVNDSSTLNSQPSTHCVSYDGNGNVTALVDAGSGNETARYEYGPFGDVIRAEGAMAKANPFRFSTKYQDDASGLVYYGHRYYSPTFQRWLNRDPLGEEGGLNLYGFVDNNPINATDALGLVSSLNFVPASELAWMLGASAAFDAGLSIGMQKVMAGPCDELNWNQVGKDVGIGAALTVGTFGLSKAYELYQAGKLAKLLRGAEELRELGRYDELTEMIAKHGDEFSDAFTTYRRANAVKLANSERRVIAAASEMAGRFGGVVGRNATERAFLNNARATFREGSVFNRATRHRGNIVIQRSDIPVSIQNLRRMQSGNSPLVRNAAGEWENLSLHHVGRQDGKLIEVLTDHNSYDSVTGGALHIPGPGGPVRQSRLSQTYWQQRLEELISSGLVPQDMLWQLGR